MRGQSHSFLQDTISASKGRSTGLSSLSTNFTNPHLQPVRVLIIIIIVIIIIIITTTIIIIILIYIASIYIQSSISLYSHESKAKGNNLKVN